MFSVNVFSQTITKESVEGKWIVLSIEKAPDMPQFKQLLDGFKEAVFLFKKEGSFRIETKNNSPLFSMMVEETNKSKWILGDLNQIQIGSKKNKFTIMHINVKVIKGETFFDLGEDTRLPLILKVKKD